MSILRVLSGLALGSVLILGACGGPSRNSGSDGRPQARGTQGTTSGQTVQNPFNPGTSGVGGSGATGASAIPGGASGGGSGGTGTRNQGYGVPVR